MPLTKEFIQGRFKAIKTIAVGAVVSVRFGAFEFTMIKTPLAQEESSHSYGSKQAATAAAGRASVDELPKVQPKSGDLIQVQEEAGGAWLVRIVTATRLDQMRATVKIEYGEQYG